VEVLEGAGHGQVLDLEIELVLPRLRRARGRVDDVPAFAIARLELQTVGDDEREVLGRANDDRGLARVVEIELVENGVGREAAERTVEVGAFAVG
jgi:hypothetical protein